MKKIKFILLFYFIIFNLCISYSQNLTHTVKILNEDENPVSDIQINLLKSSSTTSTSNNLNVKVFSTHNRNGSTNQYSSYPVITSEYDRLFDTSFSNTILVWQGNIDINISLNWNSWVLLRDVGAFIPNNGDFFSVEVSGTFIPSETGLYSFGINSDDGSDLFINNNFVVSFYGGHGMSGFQYGSINLTAGIEYNFRARIQEFGGGEGLQVIWRRPSQSTHLLQTGELITKTNIMSPYFIQDSYTTNEFGEVLININYTPGELFKIQIQEPIFYYTLNFFDFTEIIDISLEKKQITSYYFYKWDLNEDNYISISDAFVNLNRINGQLYDKKSYLFTENEWLDIKSESENLKFTIPGNRFLYEYIPINNEVNNFYTLTPGIKNQNLIQYNNIQKE